METILSLILIVALFPLALFHRRIRAMRYGYAVPLLSGAIVGIAALVRGDPLLPGLFFVVLGTGIAWQWRAHARRGEGDTA